VAYLKEENSYTRRTLNQVAGLEKALFKEMSDRVVWGEEGDPEKIGEWFYYMRTEDGTAFPIYCRRKGAMDAPEEIVLDQNRLSQKYSYFDVTQCKLSPCHSMVAYTADTTGEELYTGFVRDIIRNKQLCEIKSVVSIEWGGDSNTLFYTEPNHNRRPHRLFRRRLDGAGAAELMMEEEDDACFLDVGRTKDEHFLTISVNSKLSSEVRVLRATLPWSEPTLIQPRERGVEYFVEHCQDTLLMVTNAGCDDYKLVQANPRSPGRSGWEDLHVPEPGTKIEDIDVFRHHIVVYERTSTGQQLRVLDLTPPANANANSPAPPPRSGLVQFSASCGFPHVTTPPPKRRNWGLTVHSQRLLELPGAKAGRNLQPGANCDIDAETIRVSISSPVAPWQVYDVPLEPGALRWIREREGLGDAWREEDYVCEQRWAASEDGTQVPMTVVYRKDLALDGSNPALLAVYGAYGQCVETDWAVPRVSLLERGWVLAMCHVRGGGELGASWHSAARGLKKLNSVHDLAACTRELAKQGLSSHPKMALCGASAGGLLVGAFVNAHPSLVAAAIAKVAFVDMANTMADPSLALTIPEYEEWGDARDPEIMTYIRSYSPYDNVKLQRYPAIYATASYNDTRVGYWEPAKWVARLRASASPDSGVLLLHTEFEGGHFGSGGRAGYLADIAREYAFLYLALGLDAADAKRPRQGAWW